MLQKMGQGVRDIFNNDFWKNAFFTNLNGKIIIDDVRHATEAIAIQERGGILVKIHRLGEVDKEKLAGRDMKHPSEIELDGCEYLFDYKFRCNCHGVEEIEKNVDTMIECFKWWLNPYWLFKPYWIITPFDK
jgi:hypothetical protein